MVHILHCGWIQKGSQDQPNQSMEGRTGSVEEKAIFPLVMSDFNFSWGELFPSKVIRKWRRNARLLLLWAETWILCLGRVLPWHSTLGIVVDRHFRTNGKILQWRIQALWTPPPSDEMIKLTLNEETLKTWNWLSRTWTRARVQVSVALLGDI